MSKGLENLVNTNPATSDYPWKDIKDDTGAGDGTPLDRISHADYHQTFRKLLALAGITPNNLPDNVTNGYQYVDAFNKLYKKYNGVITSSVGLTLNASYVGKLINTFGNVSTAIYTLPNPTTLNDGESFVFVNNDIVGCSILPFAGGNIFFNGTLSSGFSLFYKSNFVELVLNKGTGNWYVSNFDTTTRVAVAPIIIGSGGGAPPFLNSWTAASQVTIRKNNDGLVSLDGVVLKTVDSTGVIFNLPTELRPSVQTFVSTGADTGTGVFANAIIIKINGDVELATTSTTATTSVLLTNVNFYI